MNPPSKLNPKTVQHGEREPASRPPALLAPARPGPFEERAALLLLRALAPRVSTVKLDDPPALLAPFERVTIPVYSPAAARSSTADPATASVGGAPARLAATWFPVSGQARGAVLMLHPWLPWGQTYFWRRGRLPALRQAGLHALAIDLPGFGASDPPRHLYDRGVAAALRDLRQRAGGLPCHVWGVSSGGYWAHPVLSAAGCGAGAGSGSGVVGAMFEDVSPHLLEWSTRMAPKGKPFYAIFRILLRRAYPFLDLRRHAPHLAAERVAYVGGGADPGIPAHDLRALAAAAGARCLEIDDGGHLQSIKRAGDQVVGMALETFLGG